MDSYGQSWHSPPKELADFTADLTEDDLGMDMLTELQDSAFEPQTRARSNTWPLPRPDNCVEPTDDTGSNKCSNQQLAGAGTGQQVTTPAVGSQKKNSSRRNAWGNYSYADLITQAISSSVDNRLTLSQIYDWMVQNVPYFKDKGDSNSSAGWKNSIRHNLSLHNRFMRVQNEGTGKSSWWMLNPDAKPGKSVRRRAASMETSKYEKRRGRVKKRVDALRNGSIGGISLNDCTPSPSSSVSEGLDYFPEDHLHSFQLSPDFRQRAPSNSSSCGRLSPRQSIGLDSEWTFKPSDYSTSAPTNDSTFPADINELADTLADELLLQNDFIFPSVMHNKPPPPPPYQAPQPYSLHATVAQSYGMHQCPIHRMQPCTCIHNSRESMSPASGTGMSPSYPHSEPSTDSLGTYNTAIMGTPIASVTRPTSHSSPPTAQTITSLNTQTKIGTPLTAMGQYMEVLNNQCIPQEDSSQNIENLIDNIGNIQGGLECNVDEVIQQELKLDGFDDIDLGQFANYAQGSHTNAVAAMGANTIDSIPLTQNQAAASHVMQYQQPNSVTPPSWVH